MRTRDWRIPTLFVVLGTGLWVLADEPQNPDPPAVPTVVPQPSPLQPGQVRCANLIYGKDKTSRCYSPGFLSDIAEKANIVTDPVFAPVKIEAPELYLHPFAVMTGEGMYALTAEQRQGLRNYLVNGGFVVASAGCSSEQWAQSFRTEIAQIFPDTPLKRLEFDHPIFHTIYEIDRLDCAKKVKAAHLEGLEIDGRIVLIFSEDGLNDTSKAGGNCCCCGGNEIRNARQVNVNLLSYALTH